MSKTKNAPPDINDPAVQLALAEIKLRAEAQNYTDVAYFENTDPRNRQAWVKLHKAAIEYVRMLDAVGGGR